MKIYAHLSLKEHERKALSSKLKQHTLIVGQELSPDDRKQIFATCDIALGNVPSDWIKASDKLQWMQLESTGFGAYLWLRSSPINENLQITYLKGMFGIPVAETILAGILCLYRGMDRLVGLQSKRQWMLAPIRPTLRILHRQRVLIAGSGAIGLHAKKLFEGFECEVTTLGRPGGTGDIDSLAAFDKLLPTTDVVVSCLPSTPQTVGLFNKTRFSSFKPDSIFVNVGRGSAVDEDALVEALTSRSIWGSVVDVSREEPLPTDHPFWTCPNTLVTQHTSGGNRGEILKKIDIFAHNLERFVRGEPLIDLIDLDKGY